MLVSWHETTGSVLPWTTYLLSKAVCVRVSVEPKKAIRKLRRVQHLYAPIDGEVEK
ncbi:hypothetical protein ACSBR1_034174 [Camellia fascicularis]